MKQRDALFICIAFVLISVGIVLRVAHLGAPSLWVDEVNEAFASQSLSEGSGSILPSGLPYYRAPFYTFSAALASKIVGPGETAVRLPAVFFGILSMLLAWGIAWRAFGPVAGLITLGFMALCHFEIGWSRTAKMYTLLQAATLGAFWAFWRGIEPPSAGASRVKLPRFFGLSPVWLVLSAALVGFAYRGVHPAGIFVGIGFAAYAAFFAFLSVFSETGKNRWWNRYTFTIGAAVAAGIAVILISPGLVKQVPYYIRYTPPWAQGSDSAQNRFLLFEFLASPFRFPLAVFFTLGAIQAFSRMNRSALLALFVFGVPFFLFSFVFTHRTTMYLFNVYPFFLILAAYGVYNFAESEIIHGLARFRSGPNRPKWFGAWIPRIIIFAVLFPFLFSPWLRISAKLPLIPDGTTNMAVTFSEWREAARIVQSLPRKPEVVIANLPQAGLYYGVRADWSLNWALLEQARTDGVKNADGRWIEPYAGTPCLETVAELDSVVNSHPSGAIMADAFLFNSPVYTSDSARVWIDSRLGKPTPTANGTVLVYTWGE